MNINHAEKVVADNFRTKNLHVPRQHDQVNVVPN